jgi:NAD(P)-dependent dehydrogenase (short-subunit alcohol dehydrogenase family)
MGELRGKTALVTGAGSGLGRELTRLLVGQGMRVGGIDVHSEGLQALEAELGPAFAWSVADVTALDGLRSAVTQLERRLGPAYLLVASAGVGRGTPAERWHAEEVNAILEVNLLGVVNSIDAVLAGMRARKSGHLVVLSSLASYRGMPLMAAYSASKAGCNALCDSLRVELRGEGVQVTTVCPGWVRTPMTLGLGLPERMLMPVEAAAKRVLRAIQRREAFVAFPWATAWQVWLMRVLPVPLGDWIAGMVMKKARKLASPPGGP